MPNAVRAKACEHCNKPLRAIGKARANGKEHADWEGRKYHKKCWTTLERAPCVPITKPSTESIVRNVLGISMAEFNERLERIGN
jgi:hypothetical protein